MENNKTVIKRYFEEVWNNHNLDVIDELFAPDYVVHNLPPWRKPGASGLKEFVADNHRMFPDVKNTVEDLVAEGDKVAVRFSATATHKGDLNGPVGLVPATNKSVTWRGIIINRFESGKIVEVWGVTDNMDLMQQLGAIQRYN